MNRQLMDFLESHQLLPRFQSGFRSRHSTETPVLKVMSDILSAADRGRVSLLGLLDMSAAFDTVDHDILFHRMESSFGVGGTVLSWIRSFLQGRTQQVCSGGKASNVVTVTSGVPQGSVLGPLFFILYTADIPLIAKEFNLSVHCYADGCQLYFHKRAELASSVVANFTACIAEIERWMASNRLKLNPDKTQFIWMGT